MSGARGRMVGLLGDVDRDDDVLAPPSSRFFVRNLAVYGIILYSNVWYGREMINMVK